MELHEHAQRVQTKADLVEFVRALIDDHERERARWENETLPRYLDALASWVEDSDGYYRNQGRPIPLQPSWRDVAEMLYAAAIYE